MTAITPTVGPVVGGTAVTITGDHFVVPGDGTLPTVSIGGVPATSVVIVNRQTITAITGAHARGVVDVSVTVGSQTSTLAYSFSYSSSPELIITINGVETGVRLDGSCTLRDVLKVPSTLTFTVNDTEPARGAFVEFSISGVLEPLLRGTIQTVIQHYDDGPDNPSWQVVVNALALVNSHHPIGTYAQMSITDIVIDIFDRFAPDSYTTHHVQSNLPLASVTFDGTKTILQCLNELATLGGCSFHWSREDLHFFQTETPDETPESLDDNAVYLQNTPSVTQTQDDSQLRNRVYVKGQTQTLLDAVNPGAAILRLSDTSGFAGGIQAYSGSQVFNYTGIGDSSPNFSLWTGVTMSPTARSRTCVLWVPELGKFFSVTNSDTVYSSDGINWTVLNPPFNGAWTDLAWSPTLGMLVAVGTSGGTNVIATSVDAGVTWTLRLASGGFIGFSCVMWMPTLGMFVAGGTAITTAATIYTSSDGITWTQRFTSAFAGSVIAMTYSSSLNMIVAVGSFGRVASSSNGITWSETTVLAGTFNSAAWSPVSQVFLFVGAASIQRSLDGISFSTVTNPITSQVWGKIKWQDELGVFVMQANGIALATNTATTPDGITWSTYGGIQTLQMSGAGGVSQAYSPTLRKFIAVGITTGSRQAAFISPGLSDALVGVTNITLPLLAGASVGIFVQRDNQISQAALGALMIGPNGGPTDGVYDYTLVNTALRSVEECNAAGDAALFLYSEAIKTLTYHTLDPHARAGRLVHVDLSPEGYFGDFMIQDVTITLRDTPGVYPLRRVTACNVWQTVEDLLLRIQ